MAIVYITVSCYCSSFEIKVMPMRLKVGYMFLFLCLDLWMQAKPKQASSGVLLGDDVLALVVEPHMDHSLMMALLIVYGLIRRRM